MVVNLAEKDSDRDSVRSSEDEGPYGFAPLSYRSDMSSDVESLDEERLKTEVRVKLLPVDNETVPCEDALPAPSEAVDVSDLSDRIMADTGTGNDLIAAELADRYPSSIVKARALKLNTANGKIKATRALSGIVPVLGNAPFTFYILQSCPTAISIGARVMNENSHFIWVSGRRPAFILSDGHVAVLSVTHDIPYIDANAYVTPIEDKSLSMVCGITYRRRRKTITLTCPLPSDEGIACGYDELGCAPGERAETQVGGSSSSSEAPKVRSQSSSATDRTPSSVGPVLMALPTTADARKLYKEHVKVHSSDSGLDLLCAQDYSIPPGETVRVSLGIKATLVENGENLAWLVAPRSSLAKTPLRMSSSVGLIDSSYRGEVFVVFDNIGTNDANPYKIRKGDRLVQAVAFSGKPVSLQILEKLDETPRGEQAFGSTDAVIRDRKDKRKRKVTFASTPDRASYDSLDDVPKSIPKAPEYLPAAKKRRLRRMAARHLHPPKRSPKRKRRPRQERSREPAPQARSQMERKRSTQRSASRTVGLCLIMGPVQTTRRVNAHVANISPAKR